MALVSINNLSFSYDSSYDMIFENVSFQINTDWKLGLIGRNGKGKTTFLNILLGKYKFSGTISSNVTFEYFPYDVKNKNLNSMEIFKEMCSDSEEWEFLREISLLDIKEDIVYQPYKFLSNGEQTKILLAILFLKENNFLLIDEPTNHLDINSRKIIGEYLNRKKGFILVSHDRNLIDSCVNHILSINRRNIEIQKGNFSSWEKNKQQQDELEILQNEKLKKEITRLEKSARKNALWSEKLEKSKNRLDVSKTVGFADKGFIGAQAARIMKRSKSIEKRKNKLIEEKSELLHNIDINERLKIHPLQFHNSRLIEFENVSLFYGNNKICKNMNFIIERGDRILLKGKNGSGKSSVLKLILGEDIKYDGYIYKAKNLKISYVPQNTSNLTGNIFDYINEKQIDRTLFLSILRKMDFSRLQFEKDIGSFSEGQRKKILIATSLCEEAHLYIWDEPLNFIDILSRIQIENLILEYSPTLLFVEHDTIFSEKIATKVIHL